MHICASASQISHMHEQVSLQLCIAPFARTVPTPLHCLAWMMFLCHAAICKCANGASLPVQAFREDRTLIAAADYIADALGQRFVESVPLNMERAWFESHPKCPLICLLSPGADPTKLIEVSCKTTCTIYGLSVLPFMQIVAGGNCLSTVNIVVMNAKLWQIARVVYPLLCAAIHMLAPFYRTWPKRRRSRQWVSAWARGKR